MSDKTDVVLRLTRKQLEKLSDVLLDAQDEGPREAGWASPELCKLIAIVDAAKAGDKSAEVVAEMERCCRVVAVQAGDDEIARRTIESIRAGDDFL